MNTIKDTIVPFLKKLWWVWLAVLLIVGAIWLLGPKTTHNFLEKTLQVMGVVWILLMTYMYTVARFNSGVWRLLRLLGLGAGVSCLLGIIAYIAEFGWSNLSDLPKDDVLVFRIFALGFIGSLILFGLGELLLYLHKINYKFKKLSEAFNAYHVKEMFCPRCLGKGWVDKADIQRLDKENEWVAGACAYCGGQGHVRRGQTLFEDPVSGYDEQCREYLDELSEASDDLKTA